MENTIIITRHQATIEWLAQQGITGQVYAHADAELVKGKDVIGILPLNLACLANSITTIDMQIPSEMRGKELTVDDMKKFGAKLTKYIVKKV